MNDNLVFPFVQHDGSTIYFIRLIDLNNEEFIAIGTNAEDLLLDLNASSSNTSHTLGVVDLVYRGDVYSLNGFSTYVAEEDWNRLIDEASSSPAQVYSDLFRLKKAIHNRSRNLWKTDWE